jgi:hypothetical protein
MPQPKTHKYNRSQRLFHAKSWMKKYTGKKIHHGYAKHFGVSKLCAVIELEMLGVKFQPGLKESLIRAEEDKRIQREKRKSKQEINLIESDDYFAFIAGYTSGGAPYGITWEEMEALDNNERFDIPEENEEYKNEECEDFVKYTVDNEEDLPF